MNISWNVWDTVFRDDNANMSLYDLVGGSGLQVRENVIYFGSTETPTSRNYLGGIESFLFPKIVRRYRDVDVTAKIEIESTAKDDSSNWFGIATRVTRTHHWDAYLFYIRKDGRVEFGIRGNPIEKPPPIPEVSSQAVIVRIKTERDRVQTWVNNRPYHDCRDEQEEFIRKGSVYLISYRSLVKIYEVEIKVKRWYAPLLRFIKRFWQILCIIGVIGSVLGFLYILIPILIKH